MKRIIILSIISTICYSCGYEKFNAYPLDGALWKKTDIPIPVCWENAEPWNNTERKWVQDAITFSWQAVSGLEFDCWCDCPSEFDGIRIIIEDPVQPKGEIKYYPHTIKLGKELRGKKKTECRLILPLLTGKHPVNPLRNFA